MKLSFNRGDYWWHKKERPALAWMSTLWLFLIGWLAFFWNLGSTGLIDETEPLFAEAARQMTLTGDWITPFFNGVTRFDKPPLIYWLMAIAYQTLGVNEWAVRLPSAIAAMGLVSLGFYTLWCFGVPSPLSEQLQPNYFKRRYWLCAGLGSALMALNLETIVWARSGVSDMLLTGCMGSALLSFFLGYAQPAKPALQARWYLAFYVLIAGAILAKGPVGIVLPTLIIASFLLYLGNVQEVLREMRVFLGGLLIMAIALPWYILVIWRNGRAYIDAFFGYHNLERFTEVVNGHSAPWYFYFLVVLVGFAPWSIYLPLAITRLQFWQRSHWRSVPRSTHLGLFALFWFLIIFGFFTLAVTKLPSYVLPLMPAAAILVALLFISNFKTSNNAVESKLFSLSGWLNVCFLLVVAGALFCLTYLIGSDPAIPDLHELIERSGLPVVGGIIWTITAFMGLVLLLCRKSRWLWSVNLLGFVAFLIFVLTPAYFLVDQARQLPLRELAAIAAKADQPGEDLIMVGFEKPSVVFYSHRAVTYLKTTEDGAAHIQKWINSPTSSDSMLLLTQPRKLKRFGLQPSQYQNLAKADAYQLLRVFKNTLELRGTTPGNLNR